MLKKETIEFYPSLFVLQESTSSLLFHAGNLDIFNVMQDILASDFYVCQNKKFYLYMAFWAFLVAQTVKEYTCNVANLGSIPGSGRSPKKGVDPTVVFLPGEFHG